jgi:metal-dependent amidase/aminoacylase/carboxypeptidase family protein
MGGIAASIATGRALEKFGIPGKVVLLGTPAEEVYGGKCYMLKRGAYDGMEGCLMCVARHQGKPLFVNADGPGYTRISEDVGPGFI